ncbi:MAG TPA: energy transducer TonB [Methylophilaceae bacterium]
MIFLPSLQISPDSPLPEILNIQIDAPKAPESVAMPEAAPEPEPAPEPPKPVTKPKPIPQPIQQPVPAASVEPQANTADNVEESVTPPVMATAPAAVETPPAFTAPPPPPPGPSQADLDAARRGYAERLARAIAAHKKYPRIAQMRGWQGEVIVDLKIDGDGNVLTSAIGRSSGYETLDNQALEMVAKAAPFPPPPEILKSASFNIQVPVSFKLE